MDFSYDFSKINLKKVLFAKTKEPEEIKQQKQYYCSLYNANQLEDMQNYNTYIYKIQYDPDVRGIVIVDIDGEDACNYVASLLKKYKLTPPNTKSISNVNKINKYKYHLYFKGYLGKNVSIFDLEILANKIIFEDAKQFDKNIDLSKLPCMRDDFFEDLIKYKEKERNEIKEKTKSIIIEPPPSGPIIENNNIIIDENNKLKDLVDILDDERSNNYDDWCKIGMILKGIDKENLELFVEFSKRTPEKYKGLKDVSKFWKNFKIKDDDNKKLTIGSLCYYAKQDNEQLYDEWNLKYNKKNKKKEFDSKKEYEYIKEQFEKTHFKILNPISFGGIDYKGKLIIRNEQDFIKTYKHINYMQQGKDGEIKECTFVYKWLTDDNIKIYYETDFLPMQKTPPNIYNKFSGYEIDKLKESEENLNIEDSLIYQHLKKVLCNNNTDYLNFILNMLSRKLKNPSLLTMVAVVFVSVEGVGKDLFFEWFGNNILGIDYYFNDESINLIFGKFNSEMENKILVIVNETTATDTYIINEKIKNCITKKINKIEHKGLKPYYDTNNVQYIFLSNNQNPLKIPAGDRRFGVIECNNNNANNAIYLKPLIDEMKSKKYDKCFYNYLMKIDSDNYNFTDNRPRGELYNNMQKINIPPIALFLEKFYYYKQDEFTFNEMYNAFNRFIEQSKYKCEYNSTKFGIEISNFEGIIKNKSVRPIRYNINKERLKCYLFKKYNIEFIENIISSEFID
jgi:hypothetical protein